MKKLGFVDYYISEWHANNYPAWIEEACKNAGLDYKLAYAWAELDVSPKDGVSTAEWCEKFGAEKCDTIEELCEKSDVIIVLAPSDPDTHLRYAERVLPYGKPTYIDKTFAPDYKTAEKIFDIAKKYNTPFFSTSALRYASELENIPNCREMMTTGSGASADEYIIHQVEMIVKKLGFGADKIRAEQVGAQWIYRLGYPDDRVALMTYAPRKLGFTVYLNDTEGNYLYTPVTSDFFKDLIADMVRFFEEKTVSFDTAETLEVMKIRNGVIVAMEKPDTWVDLKSI